MKSLLMCVFILAFTAVSTMAATVVSINQTDAQGVGPAVGTLTLEDTANGLLITPNLNGVAPGLFGFHVHENPDCGPAVKDGKTVPGLAAGGHYDPGNTGKHLGPYGDGHLGDLPPLYVAQDGTATLPVLAPRLTVKDVQGRAIMIHAGGDNFSDVPNKLGGGGARMACGVVQ